MDNIGCIIPLTDHDIDALRNDMHINSGLFGCFRFQYQWVPYWVWILGFEEVVTDLEENLHIVALSLSWDGCMLPACDKVKSMVVQSIQFLRGNIDRAATALCCLAVWESCVPGRIFLPQGFATSVNWPDHFFPVDLLTLTFLGNPAQGASHGVIV